jgi:hypothetical protein
VRTPLIAERGFLLFGRRVPGVAQVSGEASLADDLVATLEARALWSRYGL